jgi:ABC-type multidrug transport system fused ATPase/permease subunit
MNRLPSFPKAFANALKRNGIVKLLSILWKVLGPYVAAERRRLGVAVTLSTLAAVCSLLAPYFLSRIVDDALPARDSRTFVLYAGGLLGAFLAFYALWAFHVKSAVRASQDIFARLKQDLVAAILRKPASFFHRYGSSELLTRVSSDADYLSAFFYERVIQTFVDDLFAGVILVFILAWNWKLGLFAVGAVAFYVVFISLVQEPISQRSAVTRKRLSEQNAVLMDVVSGHREIRFFRLQSQAIARFADAIQRLRDAGIREIRFKDVALTAVDSVNVLLTLSPFIFGGFLICFGHQDVTIGLLVAYNAYFNYLAEKMLSVAEGYASLSQAIPAFERIRELFDAPEEAPIAPLRVEDVPSSCEIEFQGVSFAYPGSPPILSGFDLVLRPGDKVAVTGASGKGKSTVVQLLLRFLSPTSGRILMGGRDVADVPLPLYLGRFSYVAQSTYLFNLSIRENIAMGWPSAPLDLVVDAARRVRMHDFIESLPDKYDTPVRHGAFNLSGGQAQRIALARALVREPEILVLDEFTSALDPRTEAEILDELFDLFGHKTLLCVTHSANVAARFSRQVAL